MYQDTKYCNIFYIWYIRNTDGIMEYIHSSLYIRSIVTQVSWLDCISGKQRNINIFKISSHKCLTKTMNLYQATYIIIITCIIIIISYTYMFFG